MASPIKQSPEQIAEVATRVHAAQMLVIEAAKIADGFEPGRATRSAIAWLDTFKTGLLGLHNTWQDLLERAQAQCKE